MSLVSGLLNKTCKVLRPQFADDGSGGENISSYSTLMTGAGLLISQKTQSFSQDPGGRQAKEILTGYMEWVDESLINVNDVITQVTDALGNVEQDLVNGKTTNASYKVTGRTDPNGERDHLEMTLEHYHGRVEGQP